MGACQVVGIAAGVEHEQGPSHQDQEVEVQREGLELEQVPN